VGNTIIGNVTKPSQKTVVVGGLWVRFLKEVPAACPLPVRGGADVPAVGGGGGEEVFRGRSWGRVCR